MQKVVIYSPTARKGCEKIDLSLVNELISRNFSVTYAVTSNKMFLNKKFDFYGFQEKFKLDKDFQKNKTIWIEYFNDLKKIILNHDIFITGSHCSPKLTSFAKKTGKIIIQHFNPHNYDLSLKQLKADLLCTQGDLPNKILLSFRDTIFIPILISIPADSIIVFIFLINVGFPLILNRTLGAAHDRKVINRTIAICLLINTKYVYFI